MQLMEENQKFLREDNQKIMNDISNLEGTTVMFSEKILDEIGFYGNENLQINKEILQSIMESTAESAKQFEKMSELQKVRC